MYIRQNNEVLKELTTQDVLHKRVCSYAEYTLQVYALFGRDGDTTVTPVTGIMIRENGYWTASNVRGGKCRWLQAVKGLRVGPFVDRMLCSEFQMLEELCDGIEKAGGMGTAGQQTSVHGQVRMYISTTPCISCVGAMSQFLMMLPGVSLEVACGRIPVRQGWKKDASHWAV